MVGAWSKWKESKMTDYEKRTKEALEGRRIVKAEVDGFVVRLVLDDNSVFDYEASDGGYSCWELDHEVRI